MELFPISQLQQVAYLYCRGLKEVKREPGLGAGAFPITNFYFEKEKALEYMAQYNERNISALELFRTYYKIMQEVKPK